MAVSPFVPVANAIEAATPYQFLPEYKPYSVTNPNEVPYTQGTYYSVLADTTDGHEYFQQWTSNPGYEDVGIMLRSHDGPYDNSINGGSGSDVILGNSGTDGIVGRGGNDLIMGAGGNDWLFGGTGDDTLVAGYEMAGDSFYFLSAWKSLFSGTMTSEEVASKFIAKAGDAELVGGEGNDLLVSGVGADTLHGGIGDDTIYGGSGIDIIFGETGAGAFGWTANQTGADTIFAGLGNDIVSAGAGNDVVLGEEGSDTLNGDDGNDVLHGGAGDDQIHGGAGDDQIQGGSGNDIVQGGAGNDTFVLADGSQVTYVVGQTDDGNDMVLVAEDVSGLQFGQSGTNLQLVSSNGLDGVIIEDWFSNHSVEYLGFESTGTVYNLVDVIAAYLPAASTASESARSISANSDASFADSMVQVDFSTVQSVDVEILGIPLLSADVYTVA
jgi:Ca2+-binding RTX toxin-like protein